MREKQNKLKFIGSLVRLLIIGWITLGFFPQLAHGQTRFPERPDNIEWVEPSFKSNSPNANADDEPQDGGIINFELPAADEGTNPKQLQPVLSQPAPSQFGEMVRQADFTQPIQEIAEPPSATSAGLASSIPAAQENVSKLLGSIASEDGLGGKIKSTFAQIDFPKVAGSLAIVLGVYFAFVWLTRQFNGGRVGGLPTEVVEVLGVAPFGPKKNLQLVRLGSKLLLLLHSPEGTTTIGEISDSDEVEYLAGVCHGRPHQRRRNKRAGHPNQATNVGAQASNTSPSTHRTPEVTIPAQDLENVVRQLATAAKSGSGGNVFEA